MSLPSRPSTHQKLCGGYKSYRQTAYSVYGETDQPRDVSAYVICPMVEESEGLDG